MTIALHGKISGQVDKGDVVVDVLAHKIGPVAKAFFERGHVIRVFFFH